MMNATRYVVAAVLLAGVGSAQTPPVGLGNGRDVALVTRVDAGAENRSAKLVGPGAFLSARVTSPGGTLDGQVFYLAGDLRDRRDRNVITLPGDELALGLSSNFGYFVPGMVLPPGGFDLGGVVPDLSSFGPVSLWIQAAVVDPLAPNGLAFTPVVRHDTGFLTQVDVLTETSFPAGTSFGFGVASADANGDGLADLAVGLVGADPGLVSNAGQVRLRFAADPNQEYVLNPPVPETDASFGSSLLFGDVSGDGILDLVVAARLEDAAGITDSGAVYVFMGPSYQTFVRLASPAPEATGRFGYSIGTTDWNGDGLLDVVAGAPREMSAGQAQAGRVYVFMAPSFQSIAVLESPEPQAFAKFGYQIAGGQLDGLGSGDLVVTTPFWDDVQAVDTGRAHVFLNGSATGPLAITQVGDPAALLGSSLAVADLNVDGHLDLVIGAEFDDQGGPDAGSVHVVYGPSFLNRVEVVAETPIASAGFGSDVAVGDVNHDGFPDLVVGEFWRDEPGAPRAGGGWVMFGPDCLDGISLSAPFPTANSYVGRRVTCGDYDGDGFCDPVLSAPFASPSGQSGEGLILVFRQ